MLKMKNYRLKFMLYAFIFAWFILSMPILYASGSPYSKWSKGPSTDPNFFPIAVWLQNPANAQAYKDIGINTYVGLWAGPTESQLAELNVRTMPVICDQNSVGLTSANNHIIKSWMQIDEPDNAQWNGSGYDPCIDPNIIKQRYSQMVSNDNARPVLLNFGRGVSDENWIGRGTCTGHLEMYPEYIKGADIISYDIYPVTEYGNGDKLDMVAKGVVRLVNWANRQKIVWNAIETTHITNQTLRPTASQIRSEVWMSIIHGSMGIIYFIHEWYPSFREDAIFRYPEIAQGVKELNAQITELAPVLNSDTIENAVTVTSTVPIKVMVKKYENKTYIFAVAMQNSNTVGNFSIDGFTGNTTAAVLGEGRLVEVNNGQFSDSFTGYGVHLYSIETGVAVLYGDVSGDSEITAYDAALTAQAAVALITLTSDQAKAADVDGNGEVTAYDAALIAQYAVGIIDHFPVGE